MSTGRTEKVSQRRFQMLSMWQNAVLTNLMLTITESRGLMAHYEKGKGAAWLEILSNTTSRR